MEKWLEKYEKIVIIFFKLLLFPYLITVTIQAFFVTWYQFFDYQNK